MKYEYIIWDFNGTILDDVNECYQILNFMLSERNLPPVKTIDDYKAIFDFPIKSYYKKAGFDFSKESYESLAHEFIRKYYSEYEFSVSDKVKSVLSFLKAHNYKQLLLSASKQSLLEKQVSDFGISRYFDYIIGISDVYAQGKTESAKIFAKKSNIDFSKAVLVGDTLHDFETAKILGCDCILCSFGHQSAERLSAAGCPVISDIDFFKKHLL